MSLGLYRDVLDEEAAYLLSYGDAKLVFAEDEEQVDKLLALADRAPNLKHIVYSDPRGMVLLPESMEWLSVALRGSPIDQILGLKNNIAFLREMAIGVIIIVFLVFEPDGLAHRWQQIKSYWKLYPFSH